jgi:hypothetical protein
MIAAKPGQRRRIIARRILRRGFFGGRCGDEPGQKCAGRRTDDGERDAIEKVSSSDRRVHGPQSQR